MRRGRRHGAWSRRPMPGSPASAVAWAIWVCAAAALLGALLVAQRPRRRASTPAGTSRMRAVAVGARRRWRPRRASWRHPPALGLESARASPLAGAAASQRVHRRRRRRAWCRHPGRCRRRRGAIAGARRRRSASTRSVVAVDGAPARAGARHDTVDLPAEQLADRHVDSRFDAPACHRCPRPSRAAFRLRRRRRRRTRRAAARVAGMGGRPAHGSRATPRRRSAATAARSCPGSRSATRARVGAELDDGDAGEFAQPPHRGLGGELRDRHGGGVRPRRALRPRPRRPRRRSPSSHCVGFIVLVTPAAERRARRGDGRRGARRHRVGPSGRRRRRPRRSPSSGCSPSTRGSLATTASRSRSAPRPGCCSSPARSPTRLGRVMPTPLAVRARRAARRAARLPADPHPARPRDRALRRAREPARGSRGARRHDRRTDRVPRSCRCCPRSGSRSSRSRGCPRAGSRSSRTPRPRSRSVDCPWLPDAAGRGAARRVHRARALASCSTARRAHGVARRGRGAARGRLAVPVGIGVGAPAARPERLRPGTWDVAACDIGQGDAVLVRSGGATALIDTGPDPAALERCLDFLGIGRIDLLVLTHWDADHAGGVAAVGRTGRHGHPRSARRRVARPGARPARRAGARRPSRWSPGSAGRLGDARWRVVWPEARARAGQRRQRRDRPRDARVSRACSWAISARAPSSGCSPSTDSAPSTS